MKRFLIIFAKEPEKVRVKTRLKNCLSEPQRIRLYKALLRDTIEIAKRADCEERIIAYESNGESPRYLKRIAGPFRFYKQKGKDLGEKMAAAFELALKDGACLAVIIGSDSPTLPVSYLNSAFNKLKKNDLVLGPSIDGGYYLIGLKKACFDIFKNIRWSKETVFEDTLKNIKRLNKKTAVIGRWYDIDEPSDLIRLRLGLRTRKDMGAAKWTRRFFEHEGIGASVYGI